MNILQSVVVVISFAVLLVSSIPIPRNPEEAGLFEGDIAGIKRNTKGAFQIPNTNRELWPGGKITYMIDSAADYSQTELDNIRAGLRHIEDSTMVDGEKIIEITEVPDSTPTSELPDVYIKVIKGDGCWSYVGKQMFSGEQQVSIGNNCAVYGFATVSHEFMHALGWWHEQSRSDRDDYVTIHWENIQPGLESNFNKYTESEVGLAHMPYDYDSIMHYGETAFSSNGEITIEPLTPGAVIGQRNGLSFQDVREIIEVYGPQASGKNRG